MKTFLSTYKKVFNLLTEDFKKRFWILQAVILLTSIVDLAGLAAFIPVLSAVADPELLEGEGVLARLKQFSGVQENNYFLLVLFASALAFFVLRAIFIFFSNWIQNKFVFDLNEYIGKTTYQYYMDSPFEEFQKRDSAEVVRELTVNPQHFARFLVMPLLMLSTEVLVIVMIVGGIAIYNFEVFLLLIGTIFPVAYIFNKLVKARMNRYGVEQNILTPKLYANSNRGMFGFVDVKLRNKEDVLLNDYQKVLQRLNRIGLVTSVLSIMPAKLFELVTVAGLLVLFIYSAFYVQNPTLVLPLIALYAAAGYRVIPSLSKIVPAFMQLEQYSYLFEVFSKPLSVKKDLHITKQTEDISFEKSIELRNLTFQFLGANTPLFENVNLSIKKGEIIGLVGKSGSGKTTLVKVLAGFLKLKSGQIYIDDTLISTKNSKAWMQKISYVQQSPYIEAGSLASNIAFLEKEIDEKRLQYAIKQASLNEFLEGRDSKDIMLEENGKNLSGGQKQRVVIARALYHQASFIILDEATSALDNETELAITQTVQSLKGTGVTIIIIAHRLSTLEGVDRIINIDDLTELKEKSFQFSN